MLFTDPHRTESKQNSPTRTKANHGIRHSLPVSGDINLVDLGHFSREKHYFLFVFIKFLLPIRNKYIMSCKKSQKYISVHIHFNFTNKKIQSCQDCGGKFSLKEGSTELTCVNCARIEVLDGPAFAMRKKYNTRRTTKKIHIQI